MQATGDIPNMGGAHGRGKARRRHESGNRIFTNAGRIAICLSRRQPQHATSPMNAPTELNLEEMLRIRLEVLRREHRDLDEAVRALQDTGRGDALTLMRLKKQKLALKDQIVKIEDQLIPDIIA